MMNGADMPDGIQLNSSRIGLNRSRVNDQGAKKSLITKATSQNTQQKLNLSQTFSKQLEKKNFSNTLNRFSLNKPRTQYNNDDQNTIDQAPAVDIEMNAPQYPRFRAQLSQSQLRNYYSSLQNTNTKSQYKNVKHHYVQNIEEKPTLVAKPQKATEPIMQISCSSDDESVTQSIAQNCEIPNQQNCKIISMDDLDDNVSPETHTQQKQQQYHQQKFTMTSSFGLSTSKGPFTQKQRRTKPSSSVIVSMIAGNQ